MPMEITAWPDSKVVRPAICAYFLCILTGLTVLCTLRLANIGTFRRFWQLSLARKLILLTLLDSWIFAYASAVLLFGVGSGLNGISCEIGILFCILLYATSKIMIYMFLTERLYICHSGIAHQGATFRDRFKSWWYRIAMVLLLAWVVVACLMIAGRKAELYGEGKCKIGLKIFSTVPMLTLDILVNCFLTAGFVAPVMKAGFREASSLVKNSCLAAGLALITSFVNILILAIMGHQQSFICLSSCVFDVAANACILFIITRHPAKGEGLSRTNAEWGGEDGVRPDNHRRASMAQLGQDRPTLSSVNKRHSSTLVGSKHYIPTFPAFNESVASLRISPSPSTQLHSDARKHSSTFVCSPAGAEDVPLARPPKAMTFEGIQISRTTQSTVDGPDGTQGVDTAEMETGNSMPFVVSLEKQSDIGDLDGTTPDEKEEKDLFARKSSV